MYASVVRIQGEQYWLNNKVLSLDLKTCGKGLALVVSGTEFNGRGAALESALCP